MKVVPSGQHGQALKPPTIVALNTTLNGSLADEVKLFVMLQAEPCLMIDSTHVDPEHCSVSDPAATHPPTLLTEAHFWRLLSQINATSLLNPQVFAPENLAVRPNGTELLAQLTVTPPQG